MRNQKLMKIILAAMAGMIVLLLIVLFVSIRQKAKDRQAALDAWAAQQEAAAEARHVEPPDPYSGRDDDAIAAVRGRSVTQTDGSQATVGARVAAAALRERVDLFESARIEEGVWVARRIEAQTVYEVVYRFGFGAVDFGPRWFVQLDPAGPRPDGSGGVVATNALARQLEAADIDEGLRYLNRADEVLVALTEHRFEGGSRLGSALLVFFRGRGEAEETRRVVGWLVVPEQADPEQDLMYRAYFQWEEDGTLQDAWWEVNLTNRDFRARDLQANEIMALGATAAAEDIVEIKPRTLDLSIRPQDEPQPRRRALRHLLADERLVEAVGTLLSFRARATVLEHVGWELNVTDERHVYDVAYRFSEGDSEQRVTWRVDASTGVATPTSDIAGTVRSVLSLVDVEQVADEGGDAAAPEGATDATPPDDADPAAGTPAEEPPGTDSD